MTEKLALSSLYQTQRKYDAVWIKFFKSHRKLKLARAALEDHIPDTQSFITVLHAFHAASQLYANNTAELNNALREIKKATRIFIQTAHIDDIFPPGDDSDV